MSPSEVNAWIDEFEAELVAEEAAFAVPLDIRRAEAHRRFNAGEKPGNSTGIDDSHTRGYGRLDQYGFWEFPL